MCLIHFGEWGKKRLRKFDKVWIFSLKSLILKIIWSHEHTCHIMKTVFQMILLENFSIMFQNFCFFRIQPIKSIFLPIEMWRRKTGFQFKVSGPFDSFLIPFYQSSPFSSEIRFLPDSFQPIGFCFSKTYRNQIWLFQELFLSISSIPLLIPSLKNKKINWRFLGQRFKGFLHRLKVWLF